MSRAVDYDVAVVGGGMVGAVTAALLADGGLQVGLLDRQRPEPFDAGAEIGLRVSAIAPGSARVLAGAGAWQRIAATRVSPYTAMEIEAGGSAGKLRFEAHEHGLEQLGWIVENDLVRSAAWQALESHGVDVICPAAVAGLDRRRAHVALDTDTGETVTARLVVAADGAGSRVRELAGLETRERDYAQRAVVAMLSTAEPNPGIAWQRFLDTGPLAFLPLADGRSSMVWTLPTEQAEDIVAMSTGELTGHLTAASESRFGAVVDAGPAAAFPLRLRLAESMVAERVILVGDAAHQVHPLAGQGVNLGLLDAAALAETVSATKLGDTDALARALHRYERWRLSENTLMSRGIDTIQRLFRGPGTRLGGFGLGLVDRIGPAKTLFLRRACGIHREAPALARGSRR